MSNPSHEPRQPRGAPWYGVLLGIGVLGGMVLLAATRWREQPTFWLPTAGYPSGLRAAVRLGFWPLWAGVAGCGAWGFLRGIRRLRRGDLVAGVIGTVLAILLGLTVLVALGIVAWNNLDNWLRGRPLHLH